MADNRSVRLDVATLGLVAFTVFAWMSVLSYHPADPVGELAPPFNRLYQPDVLQYPVNSRFHNWCGYWGALLSDFAIETLGWSAYFAVASLTVLCVILVRRGGISSPLTRGFGWAALLLGVATLPQLLDLHPPGSPAVGGGGYLGAMAAAWINDHFAFTGGMILVLSVMFAGMLLTTDYVILSFMRFTLLAAANNTPKIKSLWQRDDLPKLQPEVARKSDLPKTFLLEGEDDAGLRVKFHGRGDVDRSASEKEKSEPKPEPKAAPAAKAKPGPLGALSSVAASILPSVAAAVGVTPQASITDSQVEEEEELEEGDEDEEYTLKDEEIEEEPVASRVDEPHEPAGPRVRNRNTKKPKKQEDDSLEGLDDTSLPEGTDEYVLPGTDLLIESEEVCYDDQAKEVRRKAKILEKTFGDFGFNVRVVEIETGPVIAQYEVELEAGLRLSKITSLADDLAIALRVPSVRIVAPIPGKNTVGIEVPNETRQVVRLKEVIEESGQASKKMKVPLFLGKDVSGNALSVDLATMPHLLIAGRTGTGKSVCLNAIICSILMTRRPDEVRMLMIDPKMVELSGYARLPHLMHPVVTDMKKAEAILAWAVDKMEERYALLARAGVRHITSYNQLDRQELIDRLKPESAEEEEAIPDHLPFIVIIADEIADLMMTAGKEVEQHIIRLAQKSRAVGIHLILATQKPTVDVITGLIKSNLPARIAFQVASRVDSRVVLDEMGADKLLGNGDMLFLWPGTSTLLRGQGTYVSDDEINRVVEHCGMGEQHFISELVNLKVNDESGEEVKPGVLRKRDELYEAAIDVVIREGRGSVSLLQRALGIGYGRAARLIDFMAEDGIVGEYNGSQAREVVISMSDWEAMKGNSGGADESSSSQDPPSKRRNRIRREDGWDDIDSPGEQPMTTLHHIPTGGDGYDDEDEEWDEEEESNSPRSKQRH